MNNLVLICAIFPVLIFIATIYPAIASGDPKHCHRYNACYTIGYNDGYTDAQDGNSPAYACVWVTVKGSVMDITMDSVWVTVALIFSMGKGVTKVLT